VKLEVLDWGGVGVRSSCSPGLGYDAHVWDKFAPQAHRTPPRLRHYAARVWGFQRAGTPADGNYSADRLGDDVLAVMDQLRLDRPVLVGHAKAGQELSSIGSRHPEKVAGLIYLDAGYSYAFYDSKHGDLLLDAIDLRNKLDLYLAAERRT
jgi:non-heme chloroperoxidase